MYNHIGLKVKDLDASVRFYTAVLAPLGHVLAFADESTAGFGPEGAPALWLAGDAQLAHSLVHVAFNAPTRAAASSSSPMRTTSRKSGRSARISRRIPT